MQEVELHPRPGRARCPFCLDALEDGAEALTCPDCGTEHHTECLREGDGVCATQGCGRALLQRPVSERVRVRARGAPRQRPRDTGPRVGSQRDCRRCGATFRIEAATRHTPFCPGCRRRRVGWIILLLILYLAFQVFVFLGP